MLLAQTRRDRKETRTRHSVRALNIKHTLEFVFIERYAMLFCSTHKMAAQTQAVGCQFCQLRKWPPARMPGRIDRPVRPLVLMYNFSKQLLRLWIQLKAPFSHLKA